MQAEIIAIGDELVSGQRLDTNSQWISSRLAELGIEPILHSTVGDDLHMGIELLRHACSRSSVVITTGGIGPTKDDLTRNVLATLAEVELEFHPEVESHIRQIFASYGRKMPENNMLQAYFPAGSFVIPNREGTAPGIDLTVGSCRIFSLPGVPYEMKEMWESYVSAQILELAGENRVIKHHTIHCFGAGESQIELMLDGMTDRNHEPRVGITASQATISLRITAFGNNDDDCKSKINRTSDRIHQKLGELVFGYNGESLADVVCKRLKQNRHTISILDFGFGGAVGLTLSNSRLSDGIVHGSLSFPSVPHHPVLDLETEVARYWDRQTDLVMAISNLKKIDGAPHYEVLLKSRQETLRESLQHLGHSGLRESRTIKQILNSLRINLPSLIQ